MNNYQLNIDVQLFYPQGTVESLEGKIKKSSLISKVAVIKDV